MTTHRQVLALAAQAIDFDLGAGDRDALDRHLATCPACRLAAARLRADAVDLESRPRAVAAPGMRDRFDSIWLPRAGRPGAPQFRVLLGLAAVLLIGLSALATVGGARSDVARASAVPSPAVGDHSIGRALRIPVPAGPDVGQGACVRVELACESDIAGAFGGIWTTATDAVIRLESDTGRVLARIPIQGHPIRIAADERYLWVSVRGPSSVVRIDPTSNAIEDVLAIDGLPSGIAVGASGAWLADEDGRRLLRLDLVDGHVVAIVPLAAAPWEVALTTDRVWVTNRYADQLTEVDSASNKVVATHVVPGVAPMTAWDYGDGVNTEGDMVLSASSAGTQRYDVPTGTFTSALAPTFGHLAIFQGRVWRLSSFTRFIEELDPQTLAVLATQRLEMAPTGGGGDWSATITVTGHSVWIRSYLDDAVIRLERSGPG